eukprot:scaffold12850_cov109-Isochrysis_galbana.AAC.9
MQCSRRGLAQTSTGGWDAVRSPREGLGASAAALPNHTRPPTATPMLTPTAQSEPPSFLTPAPNAAAAAATSCPPHPPRPLVPQGSPRPRLLRRLRRSPHCLRHRAAASERVGTWCTRWREGLLAERVPLPGGSGRIRTHHVSCCGTVSLKATRGACENRRV